MAPSETGHRATDRRRPPIRRLDERTVEKIAAGEVVERPASVAKELVENALDAGAHQVSVRLEEAGLGLIEVADDGHGIPPDEIPLAFERHATSKLTSAEQLDAVMTLGFRGEALASIAAVARVRLTTRPPGSESAYQVEVLGGNLGPVRPAARAEGTTIEVRDLFFNTPARRKFLKSEAVERLRLLEAVERQFLARPDVSFTVHQAGREVARYPASAMLRDAAAAAWGADMARASFEVRGSGGAGVWIEGVASHPSVSRGTGDRIALSVNGRPVVSRPLQEAVRWAYRETLPKGRFPVAVLHITVDPGHVDVNVHPTKREVRFQNEGELREAIASLVHGRLRDQVRDTRDPGRSGPAAPVLPGLEPVLTPTALRSIPGADRLPDLEAPTPTRSVTQPPLVAATSGLSVAGTSVHPSLTLLGQVGRLYIVAEPVNDAGTLVLIDAHAASERVVYERLKRDEPLARQELLVAADLDLTPRQRQALEAHAAELAHAGYTLEPFGGGSYRVRAVPSYRGHRARPENVLALLDEIAAGGRGQTGDPLRERVAKSTACHMAIRGGDVLSLEEMRRLLEELYATPESFSCPHGRPIMVTVSRDRLDRWFQRP